MQGEVTKFVCGYLACDARLARASYRGPFLEALPGEWRFMNDARALAGDGFDLAIVFPNSFDAALGPRLGAARRPRRVTRGHPMIL